MDARQWVPRATRRASRWSRMRFSRFPSQNCPSPYRVGVKTGHSNTHCGFARLPWPRLDPACSSLHFSCPHALALSNTVTALRPMAPHIARTMFAARVCPSVPVVSRRRPASRNKSVARAVRAVRAHATMPAAVNKDTVAVLFDFDGTLGDTETPAMRVAFWELAPYFPGASAGSLTTETRDTYVRANAGKAFEFMVEVVEEERKAAGLESIEAVRKAGSEDEGVLRVVDDERAKSGLPPLNETRALGKDLLSLQKDETVEALATLAKPCDGVPETLAKLKSLNVPFSIATTSGKPRVPVSVIACDFEMYFPPESIHSGESDFDPPRFKPDPSVYLLAAESTGALPKRSVAVEDSTSGVGSASNAEIGLIVGYVGASHVAPGDKESHAVTLMSGVRAENNRGAEIVITDFTDLIPLVEYFVETNAATPVTFPESLLKRLKAKYYLP